MNESIRHVRTLSGGRKVEYRIAYRDESMYLLEHRELKADGTPHNDNWFPVFDQHLLGMQWDDDAPAFLDGLLGERP